MSVKALLSRADGSDEEVDLDRWQPRAMGEDELFWIDTEAPSDGELRAISRALDLTDETARVLAGPASPVAAAVHDDAVEVVLQAITDDLDADPVALRILVGAGWALTQHDEPVAFLDEHRAAIQDQREVGRLKPVEFLIAVLGWHLDAFFRAAEELEREVDRLDDAALRSERSLVDRLVAMRRRIARTRRILAPHREIAAEMARPDFLPEDARYAADELAAVVDRLERATEAIGNAREMLIGTFDVHMTRTAQRTNDIMRVLTLASVALLPSVVLGGVMGMNFKVGLFEEPNLFWVVIGAMIAIAVTTLGIARWRGWL